MAKKFITVKLDKERHLRLTNSAIFSIEDQFKKPIAKIDAENLFHKDIMYMLYASLKHEDRQLEESQAYDLFDEYLEIGDLYKIFGDLMTATYGSPNEQGIAELNTKNGTGTMLSETQSIVE